MSSKLHLRDIAPGLQLLVDIMINTKNDLKPTRESEINIEAQNIMEKLGIPYTLIELLLKDCLISSSKKRVSKKSHQDTNLKIKIGPQNFLS